MKQDSYVTSSPASPPTVARVSDDTQSQGGAGWLLMKRGLYWRPNGQGYTGLKSEAGRYTYAEAMARTGHDRTETTAIHEDDAPSFAPSCSIDVKYDFTSKENMRLRRGLTFLIRNAEAGEWTLPSSFANWARQLLQRSVSDEQPKAENPKGLSPQGASAVTAGQTPHPSPVDYTEVVERLRAEARDWRVGPVVLDAAQVIEAQAAENERLKGLCTEGSWETVESEQAWKRRALSAEARIAELEKERDEAREDLIRTQDVAAAEHDRAEEALESLDQAARAEAELSRLWAIAKVRAETAESRLADAVKVIEPFAGLTVRGIMSEMDGAYTIRVQPQPTFKMFDAARSFLSTTGGDSHG